MNRNDDLLNQALKTEQAGCRKDDTQCCGKCEKRTSREKFEEWGMSDVDLRITLESETYAGIAWMAWQAAIASMQSERDHLAAQLADVVAENAYLLPKAASELSNAWVLHKYLIGIQAAIMYLDNGNKKAAQEWLYGTIAGPGFDFPDEVEDIDAWATHQMRGSVSHHHALEIIKAETPATDRFLAEQRAIGVDKCASEIQKQTWDESEGDGIVAALDAMEIYASQLRNEVKL